MFIVALQWLLHFDKITTDMPSQNDFNSVSEDLPSHQQTSEIQVHVFFLFFPLWICSNIKKFNPTNASA